MQFCLEIWGVDFEKIREVCTLAERLGYDGFFYGESLSEIDLDCWTVLSSLASTTNRIKLGPVITYLFPEYRSLALLAKQALTLQEISDGRLEFRTGTGAKLNYSVGWWYPYGIDYPNEIERVAILEEGLQVLGMLWKNSKIQIHFQGKYFKLNGANIKLPYLGTNNKRIPITVAAKSNKTMGIAAKYADIWESSYLSPEEYIALDEKFKKIIISKNIEERSIKRSIELDVIIGESDSDLMYKEKIFSMQRGSNILHQLTKKGLVGKSENIAQRIKEYVDVGIDQFFLAFQEPYDTKSLMLFDDVVNSL
jgi:alkanesulfonate monooxygenase SsuD/methylene tetrahydromethanopterin reductase-like flavin-dependent oxidoreductase (luciferase family)